MNGESPWISLNEIIYFGQVDDGEMVLQNMDGGKWLDFTKVVYVTASGYVFHQALGRGLILKGRSQAYVKDRSDCRRCREFLSFGLALYSDMTARWIDWPGPSSSRYLVLLATTQI